MTRGGTAGKFHVSDLVMKRFVGFFYRPIAQKCPNQSHVFDCLYFPCSPKVESDNSMENERFFPIKYTDRTGFEWIGRRDSSRLFDMIGTHISKQCNAITRGRSRSLHRLLRHRHRSVPTGKAQAAGGLSTSCIDMT